MTHNIKNMFLIGLILISTLATMAMTCDVSGGIDGPNVQSTIDTVKKSVPPTITEWGNATADDINTWAEDTGIPNCLSCEVYDNLTD